VGRIRKPSLDRWSHDVTPQKTEFFTLYLLGVMLFYYIDHDQAKTEEELELYLSMTFISMAFLMSESCSGYAQAKQEHICKI
jgi:hypothetical protein